MVFCLNVALLDRYFPYLRFHLKVKWQKT